MSDRSAAEQIEYRRRHAVDPEEFLRDVGAIEPYGGGENLRFTPEYNSQLKQHVQSLREDGVDTATVATMFGVDEETVTTVDRPGPAFKTDRTIRNWPSEAALVVDAANDGALRSQTDRWAAVPVRQRYRILQSLRSFQDECLFCSGTVALSDEVVESCCSDVDVVTISCTDCDRRFLEFTPDSAPSG